MSNTGRGADEDEVAGVLRVLQEAIAVTRNHPGDDPRTRFESFLADFVSTLVEDNRRGVVDTRCLVPHIPASAWPIKHSKCGRMQ